MPLLLRILLVLSLAAAPAAHAGGVVVVGSGSGASGLWLALAVWTGLQPRPVPDVSPYHISVSPQHLGVASPPPRAADSCTFVAGVRHCPALLGPSYPPRAEPR